MIGKQYLSVNRHTDLCLGKSYPETCVVQRQSKESKIQILSRMPHASVHTLSCRAFRGGVPHSPLLFPSAGPDSVGVSNPQRTGSILYVGGLYLSFHKMENAAKWPEMKV